MTVYINGVAQGAVAAEGAEYAYKSVTETVNDSDVLQDDDELKFDAEANKSYHVRVWLLIIANAAADFKFAWSLPVGAICYWVDNAKIGSTVAGDAMTYFHQTSEVFINGTAAYEILMSEGVFVIGGTPGEVVLQWAQNVAHASDAQILSGSYLSYAKMN